MWEGDLIRSVLDKIDYFQCEYTKIKTTINSILKDNKEKYYIEHQMFL